MVGCDQAEPTSYQIPKETRQNEAPVTPAATAPQPTPTAPSNMQILPGMQEAANQAGEIAYSVPAGWTESPASGIRKANMQVVDENGSAELTVTTFPGDVGGTLANINRWRGQLGLAPTTAAELNSQLESYVISEHGGQYTRIIGNTDSILGAILPMHGSTWFFKLQGTSATVIANEPAMKQFLDSVQLQDDAH